jgi:hypothetical protein
MAVPAPGEPRNPARSPGHQNWSFESAREPARFAAALQPGTSGPEHAYEAGASLCGIPKEQIVIYRHLFQAASPRSCRQCRDQAAAAPAIPSAQEQLYNKVLTAEPGPLRSRLLALLGHGARITLWINGPASFLGQHYPGIGSITDGAEVTTRMFGTHERIGLALVGHSDGELIVIIPERDPPVIAQAANTS